jgi:hypothetical protein
MHDDKRMAVDGLAEIGVEYIPFMVSYLDVNADYQHNVLVFAETVRKASVIVDEFLSDCGFDFVILNVALMNIQFTIVQKEEQCQNVGTDELDDPIRR